MGNTDKTRSLDELGTLHIRQMAALEQTRADLAKALVAEREAGATWHQLAVRSGYAGVSSVRKAVELEKARSGHAEA